jgi:hypothetical protein
MDQRLAMRAVAERVLEGSMVPGGAAGGTDAASGAVGTKPDSVPEQAPDSRG